MSVVLCDLAFGNVCLNCVFSNKVGHNLFNCSWAVSKFLLSEATNYGLTET